MTLLKRIAAVLALLALIVAIAAAFNRDRIARLMAVNSLFAEDRIVENFSNMDRLFFNTEMPKGDVPVAPLPDGPALALPASYTPWVADRAVTSIVVLHEGRLVHEAYYLGTGPQDRRISWSVAKSFLATLIGTAVDAGEIADLDAPVTQYAPALDGTAYDGASIRSVLNMASGVTFDEDYFDFWSDINRMGRVLALGASMDAFAARLDETFTDPGRQFQYTSIDTHVLSMVLRGATGQDIPTLMKARVLDPLGLEDGASYVTDGNGVAFVLGGLNLRTRDYARFGQMILQDGAWQGRQIVSADWLEQALAPSAPTQPGRIRYGYQWWIPADADITSPRHEVLGRGVYGQHLYIDRQRNVVIATNGADRAFRAPGAFDQNMALFRDIARAAAGE